ncbi:MAG: hypothetical protein IT290_11115 [Deltaproteobacteria bacterium]|nr:hypothetical protein [Deltaproteobacteria bacterium]
MFALLFAPFSGSTTWHVPTLGWFTRDQRSHLERVTAILADMRITPLEPDSARDYMGAILVDEHTTETSTTQRITSRWDRYTPSTLPANVPSVPHRLMRLVDDTVSRGAQLGVEVTPLVYVADRDPLVGFTFMSNGRRHEILIGGYALDVNHRHLLKGGILLP